MYQFVAGPLAWLSFGIFFIGLIVGVILNNRVLDWKLDRVTYNENVSYGVKGALRSIFFWMLPFGTRSWRYYPGFTVLVFVFHICLLITPIFLLAHMTLLQERLDFSFWTLPQAVRDVFTLIVLSTAVFLALRRIASSEIRIITTAYD